MDSKFKGLRPKPADAPSSPPLPAKEAAPVVTSAPKKMGRPPKRSALYNNPDYMATNFLVNIENHGAAQTRLRKERAGRSMSDLVNELLANWLKTPTSPP